MVDTAESHGLPRAAQEVRAVRTPSDEQVWRDFEQHSADYYGLLSQVVGLGGDVAASEGYLPADIVERGIVLTGGGAMLKNLDRRLSIETGLPVSIAEDPLSSVVLGAGRVLSDMDLLKRVKWDNTAASG